MGQGLAHVNGVGGFSISSSSYTAGRRCAAPTETCATVMGVASKCKWLTIACRWLQDAGGQVWGMLPAATWNVSAHCTSHLQLRRLCTLEMIAPLWCR